MEYTFTLSPGRMVTVESNQPLSREDLGTLRAMLHVLPPGTRRVSATPEFLYQLKDLSLQKSSPDYDPEAFAEAAGKRARESVVRALPKIEALIARGGKFSGSEWERVFVPAAFFFIGRSFEFMARRSKAGEDIAPNEAAISRMQELLAAGPRGADQLASPDLPRYYGLVVNILKGAVLEASR